VQKYERGANRVSASMLESVATALGAPISYFFGKEEQEPLAVPFDDPLSSRETVEVIRAYYALPLALREKVLGLLRAAARQPDGEDAAASD
jgi:transcriptional regulator with XRE-family HTH domain